MNYYLILIILVLVLIILFTNNCKENFNDNIKLAEKYLQESNVKTITNENKIFPITFIDNDNNILGQYPNINLKDIETTYVKIPKGEKGEKGESGKDGNETTCKGIVKLNKIESEKNLDINAENIYLNTDKIDIDSKLCFGGDLRNCLDNSIIEKIKLVNNNSKKIKNLEIEKKELEENLDKCKFMNQNIKNNIENNYLSKDTEIPYTYIKTQKCHDEKKKLEEIYNLRIKNNDELLNKYNDTLKEITKLKADIRNKEFNLLENKSSLDKYQKENTELFNNNLHLNSKIEEIKNLLEKKEQLLKEYEDKDINLDNYIEKNKCDKLIDENYIKKNILDNYIEKSHLDNNYKDKYGNYLTNEFVNNNYELKDLIESKKNYECNIKLHYLNNDILSDDISSQKLSKEYEELNSLYELKLENLKKELEKYKENEKNKINREDLEKDYILKQEVENNYILKTELNNKLNNYILKQEVENNYILKTELNNKLNNYINKKELENGNYIKTDNNFRDNYIKKDVYDSIVSQYRKCNDNKDYDRMEYNKLIEENKILKDEFNKFNCKISDKINYNKIDLENCKIDKKYLLDNEKKLKEDILTLGNYIDKLNSTIIINKEEIKKIENENNKIKVKYEENINQLEKKINEKTNKIEDRKTIINEIDSNNENLKIENDNYKKEIEKNKIIIDKKIKEIEDLNNKIREKNNILNSATLILQNYDNIKENNKKYLELINNLKTEILESNNKDVKIMK